MADRYELNNDELSQVTGGATILCGNGYIGLIKKADSGSDFDGQTEIYSTQEAAATQAEILAQDKLSKLSSPATVYYWVAYLDCFDLSGPITGTMKSLSK